MDVHFVEGPPVDERIVAVVTLAVQAFLDAETRQISEPVPRVTRWVAAGRLEARENRLSQDRRKRGWRVRA